MQLNNYLTFDGRCEEAFKIYEKALGGKIVMMMTHGESPMAAHVPAAWHPKIMHASLQVGGSSLMGSDAPPDRFKQPQGVAVSVAVDEPAEAERLFQALSEGAKVEMPIQPTFWSVRFGMLTDRFGIPWMINCTKTP